MPDIEKFVFDSKINYEFISSNLIESKALQTQHYHFDNWMENMFDAKEPFSMFDNDLIQDDELQKLNSFLK